MRTASQRDYIWNTIGVFLQNALSPILLLIVTRINGINSAGIFSFAFAIALILWAIGMWGGRTYQVSDLKREFSAHSYVTVRIMLGVFMVFCAIIFSLVNGYNMMEMSVIITLTLFKAIESISDAVYGILQVAGRLYISGISLTIKMVAGTVAFVAIDLILNDVFWASVGLVAINLIIFFSYDCLAARKVDYHLGALVKSFRSYTKEASTVIKQCLPIASVVFLSMFSLNIPRYFLEKYHIGELGYFGILAMPITVLALLITFLLQPKIIHITHFFVMKKFSDFHKVVRNISLVIAGIGIVGIVVAYFVGVPILDMIFGVSFASRKAALMIVIIGAIANGFVSLYMNIFTIIRHFRMLFYTLIVTNVVLIVLCVPIISIYSLVGAMTLFTVVNVVQLGLLIYFYEKTMKKYKTGQLSL